MKKLLCLCYLLIWVNIPPSYAQKITYQLYVYNPCDDTVSQVSYYLLVKDSIHYTPNSKGILYLADTGSYRLITFESEEIKEYTFSYFSKFADTVYTPSIQLVTEGATTRPTFMGYHCCNQRCNGDQSSYYSNGQTHIQGFFISGRPRGKLSIYYPNGEIKQKWHYSKKGGHIVKTNLL